MGWSMRCLEWGSEARRVVQDSDLLLPARTLTGRCERWDRSDLLSAASAAGESVLGARLTSGALSLRRVGGLRSAGA